MKNLRIFFFFAALLVSPQLVKSNSVQCDPHAAMDKGCWLSEYANEWKTVKCDTGFTLTADLSCTATCGVGQYLFGSSCANCAPNCASCFGPRDFQCTACVGTHKLDAQNVCVVKCSETDQFSVQNAATCSYCHSSCVACSHGSETACTQCLGSETLLTLPYAKGRTNGGYCLKNLGSENTNFFRQYPSDRVVTECPTGCTQCKDRFLCTHCSVGYSLYPPANSGALYALCVIDSR